MSDLRVKTATWRGWFGIGAVLIFGLAFVGSTTGCGVVECGKGTVEVDGVCTVGKVLQCAVGFKASGAECVPEDGWVTHYCGENAAFDKATGTCKGTGGGTTTSKCNKTCPAASSSRISLCGQVFEAASLLAKWTGKGEGKPLTGDHGAFMRVYNPLDFVSSPTTSLPLAEGPIDKDGCFYISDVGIPFAGFLALAVNDIVDTGTKWAFVATGETPTAGKNTTNMEIPALTETDAAAWGNDLLKDGSMILVYRDKTGKAIEGVTPVLEGKKWPAWDTNPATGKPYELFFFNDDASAFDLGTKVTKTSKSGAVVVKKAQVKTHHGDKPPCVFENASLGGSSAGTLFFRLYDVVSGC